EETGETEGPVFEEKFAECEETVFKLVDEKAIGAKLAEVGAAAANKYFVENSFAIGEESEKEASEKVKAGLPALIGQLNSNEAGCDAAALHIGFNTINELVNSLMFETTQGVFGACVTDSAKKFNPQSKSKPALEAERLKKWTRMTDTEKHNGKNDGPDIHLTQAGYKVLGTEFGPRTPACEAEGLPGF